MMMFVLIGVGILNKYRLNHSLTINRYGSMGRVGPYTCAYRGIQGDAEYYDNFSKSRVPTPTPFPSLEELTEISRIPAVLIELNISVPKELLLNPVNPERAAVLMKLYRTYTASRLPTVLELQEIYRLQELQLECNAAFTSFSRIDEIKLRLLIKLHTTYITTPPTFEQWTVERLTSIPERYEFWRLKKLHKRRAPPLRLGLHELRALDAQPRKWPALTPEELEEVHFLYVNSRPKYKRVYPFYRRQDLENLRLRPVVRYFEELHGIQRNLITGELKGPLEETFFYMKVYEPRVHPHFLPVFFLVHITLFAFLYMVISLNDMLVAEIDDLAEMKYYSPRLEFRLAMVRLIGLAGTIEILSNMSYVFQPVKEDDDEY